MTERPSFRTISDLFQVEVGDVAERPDRPQKSHGDTPDESRELGRQSLNDGDHETAIRHFRDAVSRGPADELSARMDLAGALDYGEQLPQAYREYEKALRAQDDAVEPLLGLSDLLKRYGRYRDAVLELEKAIEREPTSGHNRMKLAETLRDMGERSRALTAAQSAVLVKPDESYCYYWIGDLLTEMGRYEEALESLRAAIELSPGDDFLYLRATVAFWNDHRTEAIKALRLASDLDPAKHLYHGLLGILLEENGQAEEARLESDRASRMDRYDHDLLSRLLVEMNIEP